MLTITVNKLSIHKICRISNNITTTTCMNIAATNCKRKTTIPRYKQHKRYPWTHYTLLIFPFPPIHLLLSACEKTEMTFLDLIEQLSF